MILPKLFLMLPRWSRWSTPMPTSTHLSRGPTTLYTSIFSSPKDVPTTRGATFSSFPDVRPLMSQSSSASNTIYSGVEATSATWPSPSLPTSPLLSVGRGVTWRREDERTRGQEDKELRDFGKLLVLLYSTPSLPTATNQFCLVYLI